MLLFNINYIKVLQKRNRCWGVFIYAGSLLSKFIIDNQHFLLFFFLWIHIQLFTHIKLNPSLFPTSTTSLIFKCMKWLNCVQWRPYFIKQICEDFLQCIEYSLVWWEVLSFFFSKWHTEFTVSVEFTLPTTKWNSSNIILYENWPWRAYKQGNCTVGDSLFWPSLLKKKNSNVKAIQM